MRRLFYLAIYLIILSSCDSKSSSNESIKVEPDILTANEGFAFTTVSKNYSSSSLHYLELKTGKLTEVLPGESGDPKVFWLKDKVYFFNRKRDNFNFRYFNPKDSPITPSTQFATQELDVGAPTDALALPYSNEILLLDWGTGKIITVNEESGEHLETIEAEWDTMGGPFRPAAFFNYQNNMIFILHQGMGNEFGSFNGSQQLFVLKIINKKLVPQDLDTEKEKVQGIPLNYSNGEGFLFKESEKPVIVSRCYGSPTCKAGAERLNPVTMEVENIVDFSSFSFYGGHFIEGRSPSEIYGLVKDTDSPTFKVIEINLESKSLNNKHIFPYGNQDGLEGIFFDSTSESLYIGDSNENGTGFFTVYRKDGSKNIIPLSSGKPYCGTFIPN